MYDKRTEVFALVLILWISVFRIEAYENIFTVLTFHGYNGRRAPTIPEGSRKGSDIQ